MCECVLPVPSLVLDEVHHKEQEVEEGEELNLDPDRESYYKADPKKALKKFFDREGEMHIVSCDALWREINQCLWRTADNHHSGVYTVYTYVY